jgi:hypothetical protein
LVVTLLVAQLMGQQEFANLNRNATSRLTANIAAVAQQPKLNATEVFPLHAILAA